jgi:transcriptional regulator with XRE-family HTH domain
MRDGGKPRWQVKRPEAIGAAVRSLRQARGLTLEALANAAGMNPSSAAMNVTYLSDIERGRSNPTIGKLGDLAIVVEVGVSGLIARASTIRRDPRSAAVDGGAGCRAASWHIGEALSVAGRRSP